MSNLIGKIQACLISNAKLGGAHNRALLAAESDDLAAAIAAVVWSELEVTAAQAERWEHAHDCGELGPRLTTKACTCRLSGFRVALAAALDRHP